MKLQGLTIALIFTAFGLTACDAQTQPAKASNATETRTSIDLGTAELISELKTNWYPFWSTTYDAVSKEIPKQNSHDGRYLFTAISNVAEMMTIATIAFTEKEQLAGLVTESGNKADAARVLGNSYSVFNRICDQKLNILDAVITSPSCAPGMAAIVRDQAIDPLKRFKEFTNARAASLQKLLPLEGK